MFMSWGVSAGAGVASVEVPSAADSAQHPRNKPCLTSLQAVTPSAADTNKSMLRLEVSCSKVSKVMLRLLLLLHGEESDVIWLLGIGGGRRRCYTAVTSSQGSGWGGSTCRQICCGDLLVHDVSDELLLTGLLRWQRFVL